MVAKWTQRSTLEFRSAKKECEPFSMYIDHNLCTLHVWHRHSMHSWHCCRPFVNQEKVPRCKVSSGELNVQFNIQRSWPRFVAFGGVLKDEYRVFGQKKGLAVAVLDTCASKAKIRCVGPRFFGSCVWSLCVFSGLLCVQLMWRSCRIFCSVFYDWQSQR